MVDVDDLRAALRPEPTQHGARALSDEVDVVGLRGGSLEAQDLETAPLLEFEIDTLVRTVGSGDDEDLGARLALGAGHRLDEALGPPGELRREVVHDVGDPHGSAPKVSTRKASPWVEPFGR